MNRTVAIIDLMVMRIMVTRVTVMGVMMMGMMVTGMMGMTGLLVMMAIFAMVFGMAGMGIRLVK